MATKKVAAKKTTAKKTAAKKTVAKKTAAKRSTPATTSARSAAPKKSAAGKATTGKAAPSTAAAKKAAAKKAAPHGRGEDNYTKPELREHIKEEVMAGDKGGRPGQWSARKAQMVAHEYVAEGGGYKHPRDEAQQHLKQWGDEHWHTDDGKPAIQGETTHRYLPDEAWKEMSLEERKATDEKKVRGSRAGKQFVPNTGKAKEARHHATEKSSAE